VVLSILTVNNHSTPPQPWGDWNFKKRTVNTSNGPITGHPAPNVSQVVEFLGVRYARPPVGDLRFAPPMKYEGIEPYVASAWVSIVLT
jgi:Carboxylesterase family